MKEKFKVLILLVFILGFTIIGLSGCQETPNTSDTKDTTESTSTESNSTNKHYVDNAATGNNDGSSWDDAWQSFADIDWTTVSAGDTIYISGGSESKTYNGSLAIEADGEAGAPVTITKGVDSGHDGTVILDGQVEIVWQVSIIGRSNVTVSNLTIQNPGPEGRGVYIDASDHITVDNCAMPDSRRAGIFIQESGYCTLSNNAIATPEYLEEQTDGIYSQRNIECTYIGNHIVINNSETEGHNDVIQSFQDNGLTIGDNYCEQVNEKTENAQGIYLTTMRGGTFHIYNNVIKAPNTNNSLIALILAEGDYSAYVVSNTTIGSKFNAIKVQKASSGAVMNNIMWDYKDGTALFTTGNLAVENNWYEEDPKLGEDFVPLAGSPVKDAGANLNVPFEYNAEDYPSEAIVEEVEVIYGENLPANIIQAESAALTEPMQIVPDEGAIGGNYVMTVSNSEEAQISFTVDIPEDGTYQIRAGVYADDPSSDSFFVKIDDGEEMTWDLNPGGTGYGKWREVSVGNRGAGTDLDPEFPVHFIDLKAGTHTVSFRNRERYARLDYIYFLKNAEPEEAENGTLTEPMSIVEDEEASGGAYIMTVTDSEDAAASYTFDIEKDGTYQIIARLYADDPSSDSFFVKIDDGAEFVWDMNAGGNGYGVWKEEAVANRGAGTDLEPEFYPYLIELKAGTHTITFRNRERFARLDNFYFDKVK